MERRYGRVKVSDTFLWEYPEQCAAIFAKMQAVVLRCEFMFIENTFYYDMYSPLFDIIPEDVMIPDYRVNVTKHYDENETDLEVSVSKSGPTLYNNVLNKKDLDK